MTVHKLTDEELGQFTRNVDEIKRRLNEGTIILPWVLKELQRVIEGRQSTSDLVIDCDADPFVPYGWSVEEHQKGGAFKWDKDAQKDALYLSNWQRNGGWIKGDKLRKELADRPVLNANVLDYLLAHPHLIPEEWKDQAVFFWGTIYRHSNGNLYVRYLIWRGKAWNSDHGWLDDDWGGDGPALLAS